MFDPFGTHRMDRYPRRPRSFARQFFVRAMAMFPGKEDLEYGGKVLLPPSVLADVDACGVPLPVFFTATNDRVPGLDTHLTVHEFIAEEGYCYMPFWLMNNLGLDVGSKVHLQVMTAPPPAGTFVKVQAQSPAFLDIEDPKSTLEHILPKFGCVTVGDIIRFEYAGIPHDLKILDAKPGPCIALYDTDLTIDFETPKGYVAPPRPAPAPARLRAQVVDVTPAAASANGQSAQPAQPFVGVSRRLDGTVPPTPPPAVAPPPVGLAAPAPAVTPPQASRMLPFAGRGRRM
jgi:ubiquitin fusion degradation protein 1